MKIDVAAGDYNYTVWNEARSRMEPHVLSACTDTARYETAASPPRINLKGELVRAPHLATRIFISKVARLVVLNARVGWDDSLAVSFIQHVRTP